MRRNAWPDSLHYRIGGSATTLLLALTLALGCHARPQPGDRMGSNASTATAPSAEPRGSSAREESTNREPLVVFLGDSITAGLHLDPDVAFPAVLEREMRALGTPIRVVNAGVSGDTTAGGKTRLPWLLRQQPDIFVIELGVNDGLRGVPIEAVHANLNEIITDALAANADVLLLGMRLPPNYGEPYASRFAAVYEQLAKDFQVPLVPFFMRGVAGEPDLNLPDGIHPTAQGHERLALNVMPTLREMVEEWMRERHGGR